MMVKSERTPIINPKEPMILGVFNSLCVTSRGDPSVLASTIFVIANTAVRNPQEDVVASLKMTL
ncbi:MAG: hypothetical protein RJQ14_11710 [Marinoscillum sp.]